MRYWRRRLAWLGLSMLAVLTVAETVVTYPATEVPNDPRFQEHIELLKGALERTVDGYGPFRLQASASAMNEARYLNEIAGGHTVNVVWSSTSEQREQTLLPIRIPIGKGLLGYRIALIGKASQGRIDQVRTVDDLRKLTIGQGIGWGDVALYQANGFKVTAAGYEGLFSMVEKGRFDLFPRGVNEVFAEFDVQSKSHPELAVERNLLIYYPWPYYYFVNRKDGALAQRIEQGLRRMLADGSFDAIFHKHNGAAIERAHMKARRVLKIDNPNLPKATPLNDAALWYDPSRD